MQGLVALVARGDEVHVEAIGSLEFGGRPVERGSLFRIASTTKSITAAATLALAREGLFQTWTSRSTGCSRSSPAAGIGPPQPGRLAATLIPGSPGSRELPLPAPAR